ncbi:hypothetical protein Bhyg_03671 [Pseudolycoriella hygida]|uniref:Uncharacterized protein n=1 Tax=Pseudolycoriella hygida TaxID=35572 RepID=A0A9Q0S8Y6_9DIPT|nr:hypothetical protein Bhyg_03671 [Pseudolycoriella hygida]
MTKEDSSLKKRKKMNRSLLAVFAVLIVAVAYSDAYCSYHPFKFRQRCWRYCGDEMKSGPFGKRDVGDIAAMKCNIEFNDSKKIHFLNKLFQLKKVFPFSVCGQINSEKREIANSLNNLYFNSEKFHFKAMSTVDIERQFSNLLPRKVHNFMLNNKKEEKMKNIKDDLTYYAHKGGFRKNKLLNKRLIIRKKNEKISSASTVVVIVKFKSRKGCADADVFICNLEKNNNKLQLIGNEWVVFKKNFVLIHINELPGSISHPFNESPTETISQKPSYFSKYKIQNTSSITYHRIFLTKEEEKLRDSTGDLLYFYSIEFCYTISVNRTIIEILSVKFSWCIGILYCKSFHSLKCKVFLNKILEILFGGAIVTYFFTNFDRQMRLFIDKCSFQDEKVSNYLPHPSDISHEMKFLLFAEKDLTIPTTFPTQTDDIKKNPLANSSKKVVPLCMQLLSHFQNEHKNEMNRIFNPLGPHTSIIIYFSHTKFEIFFVIHKVPTYSNFILTTNKIHTKLKIASPSSKRRQHNILRILAKKRKKNIFSIFSY